MDSISKTTIDPAIAQRIVTDAFGPGAVLEELTEFTDGWFNAAHLLRLTDGRTAVAKIAPPPSVEVLSYEHDIIHAEIDALRLVAVRTRVPVPQVLWVDDRCRHVASPLFLMTYLPGVSLWGERERLGVTERSLVDATLGRHLRSIHAITGQAFGLLSPLAPRHQHWVSAFGELFHQLLRDGERMHVRLPIEYDDARHCLEVTTTALAEVVEPRLVLWDLWDGNVLIDPVTFDVTGIIDLERAMWGDPLLETQFAPTACAPALLHAYGRETAFTPAERQRRALYTLYLHLVMSIEGTYRQYPADPIGDWARAQLAADVADVLSAS